MMTRTSKSTVVFRRPFILGGLDEVLQAGTYSVETDEELLEGVSFPVYRRKLTMIHLHERPGQPGVKQILTVDPRQLDEALERDQAPAVMLAVANIGRRASERTTEMRQEETDRQAMERGEDDGMFVRSEYQRKTPRGTGPSGMGPATTNPTLGETR